MENISLSAPWSIYRNKVNALFELDKEIDVGEVEHMSDGVYAFDVVVYSHEKYLALDRVLNRCVRFGNVTLVVNLTDAENEPEDDTIKLYETIFSGNRIVKDIKDVVDQAGVHHGFIRFWPEVVQFFADDLTDYDGNWNGLAEDIAREVFDDVAHGVFFCTASIEENKD